MLMNTEHSFVVYIYEDKSLVKKVMESLKKSGLLHAAGIATSLTNSGEQWLVTSLYSPFVRFFMLDIIRIH